MVTRSVLIGLLIFISTKYFDKVIRCDLQWADIALSDNIFTKIK